MVTPMISLSQHRDLMALRDRFRDRLLEVSKERHLREDVVRTAMGLIEIEYRADTTEHDTTEETA